jgi:hypothetical protein
VFIEAALAKLKEQRFDGYNLDIEVGWPRAVRSLRRGPLYTLYG